MTRRATVWYVAGGVAAALVLALLAGAALIRRALDPDRLRPFAEAQLSNLLHVPVRIGRLDLHVWPTPSLDGYDIDIGGRAGQLPPSLDVQNVRIVPQMSSLLSPHIVIETVELRGVRLKILRESDGRWAMPGPTRFVEGGRTQPAASGSSDRSPGRADAVAGREASGESARDARSIEVRRFTLEDGRIEVFDGGTRTPRSTPSATIGHVAAVLHGEPRTVAVDQLSGLIGGSRLSGRGSFGAAGTTLSLGFDSLRPDDMPAIAALLGVTSPDGLAIEGERPLTLEIRRGASGMEASGRLTADSVTAPPLRLTELTGPFTFARGSLEVAPLAFRAYEGTFSGRIGASTSSDPATWRLSGTLERIDLDALVSSTSSLEHKLTGTGRLRADVRGRAGVPVARSATGSIATEITRGVLHDFAMLAAIDRAIGITAAQGKDTPFERLTATFALADGVASTRDLRLEAGSVTLSAIGRLNFVTRALDFDATALFSREKTEELMRRSKHVGGTKNADGQAEIPLSIGGTLDAPQFQVELGRILERAAKKEIERGIRRELKKLFRP